MIKNLETELDESLPRNPNFTQVEEIDKIVEILSETEEDIIKEPSKQKEILETVRIF